MIVSHRYRFIFIKTHKTAGSSMEMALAPLCGPEDIITPMESNWATQLPRNFHDSHWLSRAYASSRMMRKCVDRHSPRIGKWFYEHMPATRVRELVGESTWNTYYKFCFERNPWEKTVSYFNWKRLGQGKRLPAFEDWVLKKTHRLPADGRLYFDGNKVLVDQVFDFYQFETSFREICRRLEIPFSGPMPREKTNITPVMPNYAAFYNAETRDKIADIFQREIKLLGYKFPHKENAAA